MARLDGAPCAANQGGSGAAALLSADFLFGPRVADAATELRRRRASHSLARAAYPARLTSDESSCGHGGTPGLSRAAPRCPGRGRLACAMGRGPGSPDGPRADRSLHRGALFALRLAQHRGPPHYGRPQPRPLGFEGYPTARTARAAFCALCNSQSEESGLADRTPILAGVSLLHAKCGDLSPQTPS